MPHTRTWQHNTHTHFIYFTFSKRYLDFYINIFYVYFCLYYILWYIFFLIRGCGNYYHHKCASTRRYHTRTTHTFYPGGISTHSFLRQCFHVRGNSFTQQRSHDFVKFQLTVHVPQRQIDVGFRATFFQYFFVNVFGKPKINHHDLAFLGHHQIQWVAIVLHNVGLV